METKKVVIGADIDGPNIRVGKINGDKLVDYYEDVLPNNESKEIILDKIIQVIGRFFTDDVEGIGLAMPGIVDSDSGITVLPVRMDALKGVNMRDILENHFKRSVYVDNDTNCFVLGVKYFGRGKFYRDLVGIIIAEGVGAGVIIDNVLHVGKNFSAGEFGQIPYQGKTFEYYTSGSFFSAIHGVAFDKILSAAEDGDKKALALFEEFGDYLGQNIQLIMHAYDPEMIILGGFLRAGFKFFKKSMWNRIITSPLKESFEKIIVDVNDVPNVTLLGAAALYYNAQQNKNFEAEKKRRLKAEEDLLNERNTLYSILENIPDRIYLKDTEGVYTKLNKSMVSAMGYESETQVIGREEIEIFESASAKKNHLLDKSVVTKGEPVLNVESKELDSDDNEIWLLNSKIPLKNPKEEVVGLLGISRDISEIKKAEQRLKAYSEILQSAKKETDNILENVDEGLFLLNSDLFMGSQYSKALESIFNTKKFSEKSFIDFMSGKIGKESLSTTEHFLNMLFDKSYDETVIMELNPLQKIEVLLSKKIERKILAFNFKRIYTGRGKIQEIMVGVKDITRQVKLEEKLRESEAKAKKQMEWVVSIMRVEPSMMRDFIDGMKSEFETIDTYFKVVKKDKDYDQFLDKLYRSVHLIKGNAGILDLSFFADELHLFEDEISKIRNNEINFEHVKFLFNEYFKIKEGVTKIDKLLSRMSQLHSQIRTTRSYETELLIKSLKNYVNQISKDTGKKVDLDVVDFNANIIPYKYRLVVKDVLIQLIKNSVDHGIEKPEEREFMGKHQRGIVSIACYEKSGGFCFSVRDDGAGIDTAKLLKKLDGSKNMANKNASELTESEVADMIFTSGVSTKDDVTMISGRGVGLDAVKYKVEKYNGEIELSYKKGEFCEFSVVLPVK